jgi:hypothetical protein
MSTLLFGVLLSDTYHGFNIACLTSVCEHRSCTYVFLTTPCDQTGRYITALYLRLIRKFPLHPLPHARQPESAERVVTDPSAVHDKVDG